MNELGGTSFYDSLNKLVIGLLLLIPFVANCEVLCLENSFFLVLLAFCSWIVGLFFWGLFELLFFPIFKCLPCYRTNNLDWINHEYASISKKTGNRYINRCGVSLCSLKLYDYYRIYFEVKKRGLLGVVSQLESFSAFFRNFTIVLLLWILVILTHWWHPFSHNPDYYTPEEMTIAIAIILVLLIISLILRCHTEKKIYQSIFEAYFLS